MKKKSVKQTKKTAIIEEKNEKEAELIKKEEKNEKFSLNKYFGKLKKLFFKPNEFLSSIEREKEYRPVLAQYVIISIIVFILSTIVSFAFGDVNFEGNEYVVLILSGFVSTVILAAIWPFIVGGLIHLGVLVFRGKEKYFETFKIVGYALIIGLIYSVILIIISSIARVAFPFDSSMLQGLENTQDAQVLLDAYSSFLSQTGAIVSIVISAIVFLISTIHQLVFITKGISKYHNIKKLKAFFAAILFPIILTIIFFVLMVIWMAYFSIAA